ncbi:MAG: PilZ domain-containing protein [Deltaproteobacteria bacterium]|nr:PilZ domain-containing protein [Deltaproteobacteria bacterium]
MRTDLTPLVVPVRFSGGGLTTWATTGALGLEGAFVRCHVFPREGVTVSLQFRLPGPPYPVEAHGTIRETIPPRTLGKEAGFWVEFTDLPARSRQLIEAVVLRRRAMPTPPAPAPPAPTQTPRHDHDEPAGSRRAFTRVASKLRVEWGSAKELLVSWTENISHGGIFVATAAPPMLRETVELDLHLPDGGPPARVVAEVVQRTTETEAKATGRIAGVGLQFVGSNDDFRKRLEACIGALLKK